MFVVRSVFVCGNVVVWAVLRTRSIEIGFLYSNV